MISTVQNRMIALVVAVIFALCLATPSFAAPIQLPSAPVKGDRSDIDELISELVSYEKIDELYFPDGTVDYRYDPSVYILEYSVNSRYWKNVSEYDYNGLAEWVESKRPKVYIPLYGNINNGDGTSSARVVGYAELSYVNKSRGYELFVECIGFSNDDQNNDPSKRRYINFYDIIVDYVDENDIAVEQIVLIRGSGSRNTGHDTVALMKTDTEELILDFSDSVGKNLQVENGLHYGILGKPTAYSIEEFRALRIAREAEQKRSDFYAFFGNLVLPIMAIFTFEFVIPIVIVALAVVVILTVSVVITVKLIKKRKKHQS